MIKAFVFGKFLPFHKGHEAMIRFALTKCDFLSVLICCSDKEQTGGDIRTKWIKPAFADISNIEINILNYTENELPNTSVSSKTVSKIWAKKFKALFPDYQIVITSEPYGDFVAGFMNIRHIKFDIDRIIFPISASAIRNDFSSNWHFLPDNVKPDFVRKVVILGTESTGKTTMTKNLAQYYNCASVLEVARELIPNSKLFTYDDLCLVAEEHARQIRLATFQSPLIIIDTDIHITKSYSMFVFNKNLSVNQDIYNANKAHLYLYLNNDVAYFQDGTRLDNPERDLLDISHRTTLAEHNIHFVEISGNWQERFDKAVREIDKLLKD